MNRKNPPDHMKNVKASEGAALVEFAIVLPLLVVLVFGFTELGRMLYQQNQLTKQINVGLRYIARTPGIISLEEDSYCTIINPAWTSAKGDAEQWIEQGNTGDEILKDISATIGDIPILRTLEIDEGEDEDQRACIITATATAPFIAIFGEYTVPLSILPRVDANLGRITLNAAGEERYIGS